MRRLTSLALAFAAPGALDPSGREANRLGSMAWGIAALAILLRLALAASTHFTSEDFLITLRYAENLAHGHGLVYNVGERVLGTTTPLYTLFLAVMAWLGLPATLCGKGVNIVADGVLCLLLVRWLRSLGQARAGLIAAGLAAVHPWLLHWSISGMETSLVTCGGVGVWVAYAERRYRLAYALAALLFLLRWDSILLTGVLTVAVVFRERRLPAWELGLFALVIAPWLLGAIWFYGNPIPVTAGAKAIVYGYRADQDAIWLWRHFPQLPALTYRFLGTLPYAGLTLLACLGLHRAWRERQTALLPPLLWVALYWTAFLFSRVLLFPWYLLPPLAMTIALAGSGSDVLWKWSEVRIPPAARRVGGAVLAGVVAIALVGPAFRVAWIAQQTEERLRVPIGLWLKANSRPTDRILLEPIGYIGYYSERPVVDMVGLVTPAVLPYYRELDAVPWYSVPAAFRPEWCVLRPGERDHACEGALRRGHIWEQEYMLVKTFSYTAPDHPTQVFFVYRRISSSAR